MDKAATYASKVADRDAIGAMRTDRLWSILRSTNPLSERFQCQLSWTKAELRRRGFAVN